MTKKKVRILSIDGGGIRGIIPAVSLKYIERYLAEKAPGSRLCDHFDMIAGSSTGGILTGILLAPDPLQVNRPRYKAEDALDFYVKEGFSIFNASKRGNWRRLWGLSNAAVYSPNRIEELFEEYFEDTMISELIRPCLITTYNMENKSAYFFTSREDADRREFYLRDVLRSTSAAPTYFPPAEIRNIAPDARDDWHPVHMINLDGGVFANNPVMCAYAEARNFHFENRRIDKPTASQMQILSLGTGGGGFELQGKEESSKWGLLKWAKNIPNIMMDGATDTVDFQMQEIYNTLMDEDQTSYFRLDVPRYKQESGYGYGSGYGISDINRNEWDKEFRDYSSDMTDASPDNIRKLVAAGEKTLNYWRLNGLDEFLEGLIE